MTVTVRAAQPNPEEGQRFAEFFDVAAAGIIRQMLGRRSEQVMAAAYLSPGHDCSYETVHFAEIDGQIVGMASAYDSHYHAASSLRPILKAAGLRSIRAIPAALYSWRLLSFVDAVPEGDFYLSALAVDGTRRGEGIGTTLLEHTLERARSAGSKRIVLDVDVGNDGGRRLYERWGMTVEAESPSWPFMPSHRVLRMVRPL